MALLDLSWVHGVTPLRFCSTVHNFTSPFIQHLMQMQKLWRTHIAHQNTITFCCSAQAMPGQGIAGCIFPTL